MNSYHRSQVRVVENIAIVVDRKWIAIDTKLQKKRQKFVSFSQAMPGLGGYQLWRSEFFDFSDRYISASHAEEFSNADLQQESMSVLSLLI